MNEHLEDTGSFLTTERRLYRMEKDLEQLATKIETLETSVSDLVAAWQTANGVVSFVKWLSGLVAAIGVLFVWIKGFK